MKPFRKIERKLDRFAIHNLTLYLVAARDWRWCSACPRRRCCRNMLLLPEAVIDGQCGELLSFVFTPPFGNPILAVFALYFLYFMAAHWKPVGHVPLQPLRADSAT